MKINPNLIYPVGSIYMSINSTNPSTYFGGTWERIAKGRTLVGVDENDTDFNASSKTGGEKTHTLTVDEMPSHDHKARYGDTAGGDGSGYRFSNTSGTSKTMIEDEGGNQPHNNLQPFYTCYIWLRTA